MTAELEDRLTELEMRIAFVDDTISTLNAAVVEHDRALQDIRIVIERLRSELTGMRGSLVGDVQDEPPPPHY